MAPFPEAEDMTIKRLYVALKRDDMQLLQMGAHKLHEKYHSGYKFELLDDLRQILSYVEDQQIPNDIKELLTKTINNILENKEPDNSFYNDIENNDSTNNKNENISSTTEQLQDFKPKEDNNKNELDSNNTNELENNASALFSNEEVQENLIGISQPQAQLSNPAPASFPYREETDENFQQDSLSDSINTTLENEKPVIFTPKDAVINMVNKIDETPISPSVEPKETEEQQASLFKIIPEKELTLKNVAVFYDDKAPFIDYLKNKSYRIELDSIAINKEATPINDVSVVKNTVDILTDEYSEILKMLSTIKGDVYFVTTSKSENILKKFAELNIDFDIPNVNTKDSEGKKVHLLPLFGLSNIFYCPSCGRREAVVAADNKILTIQCHECNQIMYPDLYEALNFESNASPYNFLSAINAMTNAETWILINPPLESSRALTSMFLKTAFSASKPKKVYILSKETTKKEYYKQMFMEMNSTVEVKSDFITEDSLCEEFINSEMSTIKVTA